MESNIVFPCGTIFRANGPNGTCVTALVKGNGRIKVLRSNNFTWKSPQWVPGYVENKSCDEFITIYAKDGWTLTADVRPPKDWWNEAATAWRRELAPGASHSDIVRVCNAAYAKAREGWAEYVRRLQALYPVFTTIEKAPQGTNVPLRLVASPPQPEPLLDTLNRILTPAGPETITLTRDQLNHIYTIASGRPLTDATWEAAKTLATK